MIRSHARLELLLSRRGFHLRQHLLEWRARDAEIVCSSIGAHDDVQEIEPTDFRFQRGLE
jgi:hypothetical protein